MKKITKGKVVQNCIKVTAAVVVASGVGFQFHEINNLNSELDTLKSEHKTTVQELKIANQDIITANELAEALTAERDAYLAEKTSLEAEVSELQTKNSSLQTSIEQKDSEIASLQKQVSARTVSTTNTTSTTKTATTSTSSSSSSNSVKATYTMSASAYTTAANGDPNVSGAWGNLTASGTTVKEGRTIAVDKDLIPLGTKVRLTFPSGWEQYNGIYVAEDTGNAIKNMKIDVYFDSYQTCINFGRRTVTLEVLS